MPYKLDQYWIEPQNTYAMVVPNQSEEEFLLKYQKQCSAKNPRFPKQRKANLWFVRDKEKENICGPLDAENPTGLLDGSNESKFCFNKLLFRQRTYIPQL